MNEMQKKAEEAIGRVHDQCCDVAALMAPGRVFDDHAAAYRQFVDLGRPATRQEIGQAVLVMLEAFDVRPGEDRGVFTTALLRDVCQVKPTVGGLMRAAVEIRRTCKIRPSIAEVLAEIAHGDQSVRNLRDINGVKAGLVKF